MMQLIQESLLIAKALTKMGHHKIFMLGGIDRYFNFVYHNTYERRFLEQLDKSDSKRHSRA